MIKLNVRMINDEGIVLEYDTDVDSKEDFIDNMSKGIRDNIPIIINGEDVSNIINPSRITAIQIKETK